MGGVNNAEKRGERGERGERGRAEERKRGRGEGEQINTEEEEGKRRYTERMGGAFWVGDEAWDWVVGAVES